MDISGRAILQLALRWGGPVLVAHTRVAPSPGANPRPPVRTTNEQVSTSVWHPDIILVLRTQNSPEAFHSTPDCPRPGCQTRMTTGTKAALTGRQACRPDQRGTFPAGEGAAGGREWNRLPTLSVKVRRRVGTYCHLVSIGNVCMFQTSIFKGPLKIGTHSASVMGGRGRHTTEHDILFDKSICKC